MSGPLNHRKQAPETTHERILAVHAEAEVLRKAIGTLAQDLRMDELMDTLLRCILDVIPYDQATVLLTEEADQLFVARQAPHTTNNRPVVTLEINENPFVQRMVLGKKNILLADTAEDADWRKTEYFGNPRSWIGIPLVTRDCVHGLLSLSSDEPRRFTQEHFRLAKLLGVPLAVAIHTARLYEWTYIYSEERKQLLRKINPSLSN